MNGRQGVDRFHLDDHCVFDQQIEPVATVERKVPEPHRHWLLHFHDQTRFNEEQAERTFVDGFEETGTEVGMHDDALGDDQRGQVVER